MIGVTIGIGDKYKLYAEKAAEAFKKNTGLDVFILDEKHLDFYLPEIESKGIEYLNEKTWYLKFKIFDILPTVDSYVYFDCDWHNIAEWHPLQFEGSPYFWCVRDRIWNEAVREQAKKLGLQESEYFNAGFYIVNRKYHKGLMDYCCDIYTDVPKQWGEQCVINKGIDELKIPKQYLSKRYNWMDYEGIDKYMNIIGLHGSFNYAVYEGNDKIFNKPVIKWDGLAMQLENGLSDGSTFEHRYWCITEDGIKICN
jgi:lipopolysaccharide biosynthesis glycosyltransferase